MSPGNPGTGDTGARVPPGQRHISVPKFYRQGMSPPSCSAAAAKNLEMSDSKPTQAKPKQDMQYDEPINKAEGRQARLTRQACPAILTGLS